MRKILIGDSKMRPVNLFGRANVKLKFGRAHPINMVISVISDNLSRGLMYRHNLSTPKFLPSLRYFTYIVT